MTDPQQLRAIVAAWWEDTFVDTDYVIDRGGNYRNAKDCIEDIVVRARAAMAKTDGPAVPEGREPVAVTKQPSDEEWDALVERSWDKYKTVGYQGGQHQAPSAANF